MKKIVFAISLLVILSASGKVFAAGTIIINEMMYDLSGTDDDHEWIEIKNISGQSIDLTGWKFNDGSNHLLNAPPKNGGQGSLILSPGGFAILADNASVFLSDHPGFGGILIDTVMSLNNTSEILKILNADGQVIDEVSYTKEMGAAGDGYSLERINDYSIQFCVSQYLGGSAGLANVPNCFTPTPTPSPTPISTPILTPNTTLTPTISLTPSPSQILNNQNLGGQAPTSSSTINAGVIISLNINEFIPNPDGSDEENEWIEIYNPGTNEVNLNGWKLKDASDKEYNFKDEKITSGGYLVLNRPQTKITINNDAETLSLIAPDGTVVSQIEYSGGSQEGYSFARYAKNDWRWTNILTPGKINQFSQKQKQNNSKTAQLEEISSTPFSSTMPLSAKDSPNTRNIIFIALGVGFVFSLVVLIFMKKFI